MKISTAMNMLQKKYAEALKTPGIKDPVAWALYQTWRQADIDRQRTEIRKRQKEETKQC